MVEGFIIDVPISGSKSTFYGNDGGRDSTETPMEKGVRREKLKEWSKNLLERALPRP
jgi:hypothetical protein